MQIYIFNIGYISTKSRKTKQYRIGQDKGEWKYGCLAAIFAMLFGEREYSTPLSALFFKQYSSTQFDNRALILNT